MSDASDAAPGEEERPSLICDCDPPHFYRVTGQVRDVLTCQGQEGCDAYDWENKGLPIARIRETWATEDGIAAEVLDG